MNISTSILRSIAPVAFTAMSLHALGCIAGPSESGLTEEDFLGSVELGLGGDPGTENHLRDYVLMDYGVQQTVRDIGDVPLVDAYYQLPEMTHMPGPYETGSWEGARAEFLEVLIGCALTPRHVVTDPYHIDGFDNSTWPPRPIFKTYHGELGIAPDWTSRGLTLIEKRYITGCVMERVNRFGATVTILLEAVPGNFLPLEWTQDVFDRFPFPESRAWGNMFDSQQPLPAEGEIGVVPLVMPFKAYICHEPGNPFLQAGGLLRLCDGIDGCGFTYVGECDAIPSEYSEGYEQAVSARLSMEDLSNICQDCLAGDLGTTQFP